MSELTRTDMEARDAADPLRRIAQAFAPGDPGVLYFDANSIGAMPSAAEAALRRLADEWRRLRRRGWSDSDWLDAPLRLGARLAPVIGAEAASVAVCDGTSVNLHKALSMALALRPGRRKLVTEAGTFPSDLYVADQRSEEHTSELSHRL